MSTGPMNTGPLIPGPLGTGGRGASRFGIQVALILGFLFLCGLAGAGIKLWRTGPVAVEAKPPAKKFSVVLSAADLDIGRELRSSDMYTVSVGADEFRTLIAGKTCFGSVKELVGRIIRKKVPSGSPFSLDCVYPDGTGPTPADLLSDGMRAVTVRMGLVGGLRGLVSPESWVDVMFRRMSTNDSPESTSVARTHTLFAGVRVLGIQDSLYPETVLRKDARGTVAEKFEVTLELTPAQCEVLKSVEDRGELSLNMLPRQDGRYNDGSVPDSEIMKILLGVQPPEIPLMPTPIPSVRVIRGGSTSSVPVEQVVDTIIDSHLYPAPADDSIIVPVPQGSKPAVSEDQWPPKSTLLPPNSGSQTSPQSPPPVPQIPGSPSPGASRPAGTSGGSTMVRRSPEAEQGSDGEVARVRVIPMVPGSVPQTRRVFTQVSRSIVGGPTSGRYSVPGRVSTVVPGGRAQPVTAGVQRVRSVPMPPSPVKTRVSLAGSAGLVRLSAGRYSDTASADAFWAPVATVRSAAMYDQRSVAAVSRGSGYSRTTVPAQSTLPGLRVIAGTGGVSGVSSDLRDVKVGRR